MSVVYLRVLALPQVRVLTGITYVSSNVTLRRVAYCLHTASPHTHRVVTGWIGRRGDYIEWGRPIR